MRIFLTSFLRFVEQKVSDAAAAETAKVQKMLDDERAAHRAQFEVCQSQFELIHSPRSVGTDEIANLECGAKYTGCVGGANLTTSGRDGVCC
jgi:hypothetical protein